MKTKKIEFKIIKSRKNQRFEAKTPFVNKPLCFAAKLNNLIDELKFWSFTENKVGEIWVRYGGSLAVFSNQ